MIKFLLFIIIMGALVGFFWHDEVSSWFSGKQQQAEEQLPGIINQGVDQAKNWWENKAEGWADQFVAELTSIGKQKIDTWLAQQNLNEYGDPQNISYTGGTPLFNEVTGETIDRYVYLLQKFPELVNELNLDKYLKK